MNRDRFQKAKRIYGSALEIEPGKREAFLKEACGGDESLRKEVESLLACQPVAREFFKSPAMEVEAGVSANEPPADLTGRTLLHYSIVEKIGEGGMGVVYKARDLHLDRRVAIKILPPEAMADPERKRRFVQEAKAASALNHPNIIQIHDINSDGGVDFIAMEYVAGKTLDRRIGRKGLPIGEALKYAVPIADALAAAHAAGIIHRDLKPANIMIAEKGQIKVLDFGLAKLTQAFQSGESGTTGAIKPSTTEEGQIIGTAAYMSPEQAEGKPVDARSDIFSFGSVLYEMVAGRRAFEGDSSLSTLSAILNKEPAPFEACIPHDLEKIIRRCLRKDPEHRFQFMADLKVELDELRSEHDSRISATEVSTKKHHRRRWLLAVAISIPLLAVSAWFIMTRSPAALPAPKEVSLTSYAGRELYPSFSPDGKRVVFAWNGEKQDNCDIYVKQVDSEARHRLTTDPGDDVLPVWSPDDRQIAFVRVRGGKSAIYLISPLGGPEQKLTDTRAILGPQMSWSPDGKWLAVAERQGNRASEIWLIPTGQGGKRRLTSNPSFIDHSPSFSPDGRFLAYVSCEGTVSCDAYLLELGSDFQAKGSPRRLTHQGVDFGGVSWTADGRSIVYAATAGDYFVYLWRIPVYRTEKPERLELAGRAATYPAVSRTGNRLAFVHYERDSNIWRFKPGSPAEVFPELASTREENNPQFSPDGRKIAFASDRSSGRLEIWTCNRDGSNLMQLTDRMGRLQGSPRWSPDGRWIAFDCQGEDGHTDIYVIDSAGGQPRRFTHDPSDDSSPSWSGDGKWVYFRSSRSGRNEIWRGRFEGGEPLRLTDNGGFVGLESWDGRTLYYIKGTASPVFARAIAGGPESQILDSVVGRAFFVFKEGIYHIARRGSDGYYPLQFFEFASGKSRVLARIDATPFLGLTVSPDRSTVLFTAYKPVADLMMIENFR